MHCASLLRSIFASLARANERVHVHNERNFPQAKLDSEMLVFEQGDIHFLLHNNSVHIIPFNFKRFLKFLSDGKKIEVKTCTKLLFWDIIYDRKNDYTNASRFLHKLDLILFQCLVENIQGEFEKK